MTRGLTHKNKVDTMNNLGVRKAYRLWLQFSLSLLFLNKALLATQRGDISEWQQTSGRQLRSFTSDAQEFLTPRSWVSHFTRVPSKGAKKRQSDRGFCVSVWDSRGNQQNQRDCCVSTNHEAATAKVLLKSPDS